MTAPGYVFIDVQELKNSAEQQQQEHAIAQLPSTPISDSKPLLLRFLYRVRIFVLESRTC